MGTLVKPKKTRLVRFNLVLAKIQLLFNNFVIIVVAERFAGGAISSAPYIGVPIQSNLNSHQRALGFGAS